VSRCRRRPSLDPHHVGVISQKLKTDDYIYYDPDVVPAVAWILP
jgi:hypothetical protein